MEIVTKYKAKLFIITFAILAIVFSGCNKYSDLGMDLLPSTDLLSVRNKVIKEDISAYTFREDSIRTDASLKSLLGSMNDSIFGNTTVDFATQFRIPFYHEFGENPELDSVKLYLYYRVIYGDTITPQHIKVYELNESIYADQKIDSTGKYSNYPYYQNVDLKSLASTQMIGELVFTPKVELDPTSGDIVYQPLVIPLDATLGEKLMNADSLDIIDEDAFVDFFKGLYIETEKLTDEPGTILALDAAATDAFRGSGILVYYNNQANRDTITPDTLSMPYVITSNSARINRITHDYSETEFVQNLNVQSNPDSLIYLQTMGGLEAKINIENLSSWNDSVNTAINKAELIFQVDTILSDPEKYPLPDQLLFTIVDSTNTEILPKDYSFSPTFYGGYLNEDYTYRFNITQHMQQIIDGEVENKGFYLTTVLKNSEAKRVVLKGSSSKTGIKLIVTYSKFLQ